MNAVRDRVESRIVPGERNTPPRSRRTNTNKSARALARTLDLNEILDIAIERLRETNARDRAIQERAGEIP